MEFVKMIINLLKNIFFKKNYLIFLIITLMFFSFSKFVFAGCFLYPQSGLYCENIELSEAQQECSDYNCEYVSYFSNGPCSNQEQCNLVFCKNYCAQEFLGRCSGGEVQKGQEKEWCAAGCCVYSINNFSGGNQLVCDYKNNQWACMEEARGKGILNYVYLTRFSSEQCNICASDIVKNYEQQMKNISLNSLSKNKIDEQPTVTYNIPDQNNNGKIILFMFLFIMLIGTIFYYFYQKKLNIDSANIIEINDRKVINNAISNFKNSNNINFPDKLNHELYHYKKLKNVEKEEIFMEFGLEKKQRNSNFSKLKDIVLKEKLFKINTQFKNNTIPIKEKNISLVKNVENKIALNSLRNIVSKEKINNPNKIDKPIVDNDDIFNRLRNIWQKKIK